MKSRITPQAQTQTQRTVWLQGIQTAVPPRRYSQTYARDFMKTTPLYGEKERRFLDRVYADTGIEYRHTVVPDYDRTSAEYQFFSRDPTMLPEPTPAQRNDLFIAHAAALTEEAARGLLFNLSMDPGEITHLITVSCTGFSAPGFDLHLVRALGLNQGVFRYHLGFMGCFAAFPALRLAHTICSADPDARVLIADVELCTLHLQFKPDLETIVANAIFADGAAAALVSTGTGTNTGTSTGTDASPDSNTGRSPTPRLALRSFNTRILPDSEEDMSWRLGEVAFDMRLSTYVPRIIQRDIGGILHDAIAAAGTRREDIALWAIHPGGRAILDRIGDALELTAEDLDTSASVLRDYGNMSSATIFFVLQRMLSGPREGPVFAAAFGPGLTVESAFLELVHQ